MNSTTQTKQVLVSHAGKQHAYRHAAAVERAGRLGRFVTSSYYSPDRFPDLLVSKFPAIDKRLRRRHFSEIPSKKITRRWRFEVPELFARSVSGNSTWTEKLVYRRDARFDRWVSRKLVSHFDIFWGFQGSCLESLKRAQECGAIAICEFATAHVDFAVQLLALEAEKHPDWAHTISNYSFPDWYRQRLQQEPFSAQYCIAASQFTRKSLEAVGVQPERILQLPLGADLKQFRAIPRSPDGPFRILFVGGVGQRKGIKYLLEAYKKIRSSETELVILGPLIGGPDVLREYAGIATILGRVDQDEVARQMQSCHVLVLPSVFEGFGLVIPEAMATGMPVIASTHTIGPEVIKDGDNGFVLEPDDIEGLAERMQWLADHRTRAVEMGMNAARDAQSLGWEQHAQTVRQILEQIDPPSHSLDRK